MKLDFSPIAVNNYFELERVNKDSELSPAEKKGELKVIGDLTRCVQGYSKREGFFGKLGGLMYRIWNAVKAIFGCSDWQKARNGLVKLIKEDFYEKAEKIGGKLPSEKEINKKTVACVNLMLKNTILINEDKNIRAVCKRVLEFDGPLRKEALEICHENVMDYAIQKICEERKEVIGFLRSDSLSDLIEEANLELDKLKQG